MTMCPYCKQEKDDFIGAKVIETGWFEDGKYWVKLSNGAKIIADDVWKD